MRKEELESCYRKHHERGNRYGYLYCGGERGYYIHLWVGEKKRVLDLGCRDGTLTQFYARGNEVTGVDIDRKALEMAKDKLHIDTMWVDLNAEWPFAEASFDVIVACEILEHLYSLEQVLERVRSTLKPGGIFIGSVPNAFRMRNRMKFLMGREFETDPTHVRQFSFHRLQRELEQKFCHVEIIPIQGKIFPFLKVSSRIPRVISRLFAKDLLWRCTL